MSSESLAHYLSIDVLHDFQKAILMRRDFVDSLFEAYFYIRNILLAIECMRFVNSPRINSRATKQYKVSV